MKRFGVSLENELLDELDSLAKRHKLPNRSQAIRHLIRKNIVEENWENNDIVSGCIVLVYDHHMKDVVNKSISIQHDFPNTILAVQHVHLDHHNCLETIAVKGKARLLRKLADSLIGLKGIKHGEIVMSGVAKNLK